MEFDFKNKRTEKIYNKMLNKDFDFENSLNIDLYDSFYEEKNGKPDNFNINLDAIQVYEIYGRSNRRKIEKLFKDLTRKQIINNRTERTNSDIKKTIKKIINNNTSSISLFHDLKIKLNGTYIKDFTLSVNAESPQFFRIIYNFYLTDSARYNLWKLASAEVKDFLEIKDISPFKIRNKKYRITHNHRFDFKKKVIKEYEEKIIKEINLFIKHTAPGFLSSQKLKCPCTFVYSYNSEIRLNIYKGYKYYNIQEKDKSSDFLKIIAAVNDSNDNYYSDEFNNYFIPSDQSTSKSIMMKVFLTRDKHFPIQSPSWLVTIENLLIIQFHKMKKLLNESIENDIIGNKIRINKSRKEIRKINSINDILTSSYKSEKYFLDMRTFKLKNINHNDELDFISQYINRIEMYQEKIKEIFKLVKNVYDEKDQDNVQSSNIRIQIIIVILTLFTILQGINTCHTSSRYDSQTDINHSQTVINKSITDDPIMDEK